jgi:uncharacterized membrane protein YoaK (UPF0700 family)
VTGTLTNAVARFVHRLRGEAAGSDESALPGEVWAVYALGAVVGALVEPEWGAGAIGISLAIVTAVSLYATQRRRSASRNP